MFIFGDDNIPLIPPFWIFYFIEMIKINKELFFAFLGNIINSYLIPVSSCGAFMISRFQAIQNYNIKV